MLHFSIRPTRNMAVSVLALVVLASAACSGSSTDNGYVPPGPPPAVPIVFCPPSAGNPIPRAALGAYQDSLLNGTELPHHVYGSGTDPYGNELDDAVLVLSTDSTYYTHGDGVTNGGSDDAMVQDYGVYTQCGSTLHLYSLTHHVSLSAQLSGGTISISLPAEFMDRFEPSSHPPYRMFFARTP
jgi:hypothetical protein